MRLGIQCQQRLGICAEILDILARHNIDLRSIEIDPKGEIFLNFPTLEFEEFSHLMPEIRLLDGVNDVNLVDFMPHEQKQQELQTLLAALPDPIVSINISGDILIANNAALTLLDLSSKEAAGKALNPYIRDYKLLPWLANDQRASEAAQVKLQGRSYLLEIHPVYVSNDEAESIFAGAVLTFKTPERLGNQMHAYQHYADQFDEFMTESASMKQLITHGKRMASMGAPLLITGETGTGKELLAKSCHQNGIRKDNPFLVLNCSAMPDDAAETELFGIVASNATGNAQSKKGIVELAEGGTVFLDEIGDMSPLLQSKFLRLLQDGTYRRVGDEVEYHSNVRIICSTQKDLMAMCHAGEFREDLFYRLNVLTLHLPPLRERKKDILPLANYFLAKHAAPASVACSLSPEALSAMQQYNWPGNVRQLENIVLRAISIADSYELNPNHLQLPNQEVSLPVIDANFDGTLEQAMKHYEAALLKQLYPSYPSSRQLGKKLGVSHTAIANKLREYHIGIHSDG